MKQIKFKKLDPTAIIPKIHTDGSAGFDLTAISVTEDVGHEVIEVDTGTACEIPEGYVGLLVPRSSIYKYGLSLCNSCGIIDSDYRGSIKAKFYMHTTFKNGIPEAGDRLIQLVVVPCLTSCIEVSELSPSIRDLKGFGSTGR